MQKTAHQGKLKIAERSNTSGIGCDYIKSVALSMHLIAAGHVLHLELREIIARVKSLIC